MLTAGSPRTFISSLFVKKSDLLKTWSSGGLLEGGSAQRPSAPSKTK